ncbi:MAG: sulfatase-like hydrolase/transferase [Planctomycetota bacterium]
MTEARSLAAVALLVCAVLAPAQDSAAPPNILVILTDDMGYGDLSCYGSEQIQTPHIDALAAAGVRCTQGYVTAPVCSPSRAGLLVGRYQNRFGFEHNLVGPQGHYRPESLGIPRDEQTIADRLQRLGYRTGCIGKWHVGRSVDWQLPNARGFGEFFGTRLGGHEYFVKADRCTLFRNGDKVTEVAERYLTDWFTSEALAFVDATPEDRPWFLYLAYTTPHTPLQAKTADLAEFRDLEPERRRTYAAMQRCLDDSVGRLLGRLDETGAAANTLVVFLNDNGGYCSRNGSINAPLRGQKGTMLEGGLRVPFLWRWPGRLPAGAVYDPPISAVDLMPTLVAAAGGRLETEWVGSGRQRRQRVYDGVDLLPFLRGDRDGERPHPTLYWRFALRGAAIRDGDWKLLRLPHRAAELYDLATDASELRDLAASEPARVEALMAKLFAWECTFERPPMWLGPNSWLPRNRNSYDRDYALEQPGR